MVSSLMQLVAGTAPTRYARVSLALISIALFVTIGTGIASAQTPVTGSVSGYVHDEGGGPLPGVTVLLVGEQRATTDQRITNAEGFFVFPTVQLGQYTVQLRLDGFQDLDFTGIAVGLNSKARFDFNMTPQAAVTETVTVVATAPAIETTEAAIKSTVTYEQFVGLPSLSRDFQSIVDTLPGVTKTGANFNIGGARSTQNIFMIDGARNNDLTGTSERFKNSLYFIVGSQNPDDPTVGLDTGFAIQQLNQDAIAEIQVVSTAYSAEYGQGSGGVINLITRSGTDSWNGGFTFNYQDASLSSEESFDELRRTQESVFVGGPLARGKTWFFATYERDDYRVGFDKRRIAYPGEAAGGKIRSFALDTGLPQSDTAKNRFTAKFTSQLSESNVLNLTFNYGNDASDFYSAINRPTVDQIEPRLGENKTFSVLVNDFHTFDNDDSLYSLVKFTDVNRMTDTGFKNAASSLDLANRIAIPPPPIVGEQPIIWGVNPDGSTYFADYYVLGAFGETLDAKIKSFEWKETYTRFAGNHAIKAGVHWERFNEDLAVPARDLYVSDNLGPDGYIWPLATDVPLTDQLFVFFATGTPVDQRTEVDLNMFSAFLQDDWSVDERWMISAGLRFDHDDFLGNYEFSPRVHTTYDLTGDGRLLLRAGVGVFRDRANLLAIEERTLIRSRGINFDRFTGEVDFRIDTVPAQNVFLTDDFKSPVTYEANIGLEYELDEGYVLGANVIYKDFQDLVWTKVINEPPLSGPPPDPTIPANSRLIGNFGLMKDTALELTFRKRFSRGQFFNVNYTFEDTEGNSSQLLAVRNESVIDNFQEAPDQEARRHAADYEVRHALKVSGMARLPFGINLGTILKARSGRPWTPEERIAVPRAHFVAPEGINARRLPSEFQWDLSLAKAFTFGNAGSFEVYADVFNVTNHENVRTVQQIITTANFEEPLSFLLPRTAQLGVRVRF